jgi:hypothetical protein
MSIISASNTINTAFTVTGDTTGNLVYTTGGVNTTALTLSNAQVANFTNPILIGGNQAINGPAFRAGLSSTQSISANTATKIQFNSETFDTNNNYDNTTNYRFTPTVAGYYQVNAMAQLLSTASTVFFTMIYKNGSNYQRLGAFYGTASEFGSSGSALVYCNGSTDYIEVYAYIAGTSPSVYGEVVITSFSASMTRGA